MLFYTVKPGGVGDIEVHVSMYKAARPRRNLCAYLGTVPPYLKPFLVVISPAPRFLNHQATHQKDSHPKRLSSSVSRIFSHGCCALLPRAPPAYSGNCWHCA